ncbi:hypothetical protein RD792_003858 [Penstemon davidsonii]|uniref:serine O-acetyltransferase n=1 Tax=Penstemon davidsonii TaxID=160366 RepID=A0ABR0DFU9_9LAMI|nr:hypothetical protein RD792_003858 [Penstemon davidsonii]
MQAQRVAHKLWTQDRHLFALSLQSRISDVFCADIRPGAIIGEGMVLLHGIGVVIGETAVVGENVSMSHHVTLGGTGKVAEGDRHPKIGDEVFIKASASVLGNIRIGKGAHIGVGSLVLKEVPEGAIATGSPARLRA